VGRASVPAASDRGHGGPRHRPSHHAAGAPMIPPSSSLSFVPSFSPWRSSASVRRVLRSVPERCVLGPALERGADDGPDQLLSVREATAASAPDAAYALGVSRPA